MMIQYVVHCMWLLLLLAVVTDGHVRVLQEERPEYCRCEVTDEELYNNRRQRHLESHDAFASVVLVPVTSPSNRPPTARPTPSPTATPTVSLEPTLSSVPSSVPTVAPSKLPTSSPTVNVTALANLVDDPDVVLDDGGVDQGERDVITIDTTRMSHTAIIPTNSPSEETEDDDPEVTILNGYFIVNGVMVLPRDEQPCDDFVSDDGQGRMLRGRKRRLNTVTMFECSGVLEENSRLFDDGIKENGAIDEEDDGVSAERSFDDPDDSRSGFGDFDLYIEEESVAESESYSTASNGDSDSQADTDMAETRFTRASAGTSTNVETIGDGVEATGISASSGRGFASFRGQRHDSH